MDACSEGLLMVGVYFLTFSCISFRSIVVYLESGSRLTCSIIFLHFLQKYRCVPQIRFSAEMSIGIFVGISIDMFIGISMVILLTFIDKEGSLSLLVELVLSLEIDLRFVVPGD